MGKGSIVPQEKEHYENSFLSCFFTEASSFHEWKDVFSTRFSGLLIRLLVPICIYVKRET